MDARQMREIPIADFLNAMGIHPTKQKGNVLGRYATLEKAVAKLQSSGIVTKADGIEPFAMHTVSNLLAVRYGNVGIDTPFFQVAQQFGVLQWSHPNIIEDWFFLYAEHKDLNEFLLSKNVGNNV